MSKAFNELERKYAEKFGDLWPYEYGTGKEAEGWIRKCLRKGKPADEILEVPTDGEIIA